MSLRKSSILLAKKKKKEYRTCVVKGHFLSEQIF